MKRMLCIAALLVGYVYTQAQQVSTLYFLENAPMRHTINPAFQPVSNGYLNFSPVGFSSFSVGNNCLTVSDVIFKDSTGNTITALHENADRDRLLRLIRKDIRAHENTYLNILSFGSRTRNEKGYWHVGIDLRVDAGESVPKSFVEFISNGASPSLTEITRYNLSGLGANANAYAEIGGGYSHIINDQWTVGGKLKLLLGYAYATTARTDIELGTGAKSVYIDGFTEIYAAAPLNLQHLDGKALADITWKDLYSGKINDLFKPAGFGAAVDLGATYKPHPQVQISAAVTDLGFVAWKGVRAAAMIDTLYTGVGTIPYDQTEDFGNRIGDAFSGLLKGLKITNTHLETFARMPTAKLNVGVDANFCNNILGVGLLSATRFYAGNISEEITLGGAVRPCNWFNLAVSYSLIENGKYSNIGAGLSFMPYDGINLTLAMDYIPTSYAAVDIQGKPVHCIPYKTNNFNVALGFSIVWGTNKKKDSDKDGVLDKWDMCPNTPKGVRVDMLGCPIDSDGDGVPDYMDECIETPVAAYGWVDEHGCPTDEDMDGVPDYKDECSGTPVEARAYVDEKGCDKDTDGDGVPDYIDQCPDSPLGAAGYVDSIGCELDTDGDGVPDWRDRCPNTPVEARGFIDEYGCNLDTDGDGVDDYLDECPKIPGVKENKGCPVLKRSYTNVLKKAMSGIQFETGKAVIKKSSNTILNQVADIFLEDTTFRIEVQGHTDNVGNPEANKTLSQKRADAVREYIIKRGVNAERLTAVGYGDERPIADNATSKGRATNRRVEFDLTYEEHVEEIIYDRVTPPTPSEEEAENGNENENK